MYVGAGQHEFPSIRVLLPELFYPPRGVPIPYFRRVPTFRAQLAALALVVSQDGIDESAGRRLAEPAGGLNRVIHDRIGLCAGVLELGQADQQQASKARVSDRRQQQLSELRLQQAIAPEALVADVADGRALGRREIAEMPERVLEGGAEVSPGEGRADRLCGAKLGIEQAASGALFSGSKDPALWRSPAAGKCAPQYRGAY